MSYITFVRSALTIEGAYPIHVSQLSSFRFPETFGRERKSDTPSSLALPRECGDHNAHKHSCGHITDCVQFLDLSAL
jgi:hypothetical protein